MPKFDDCLRIPFAPHGIAFRFDWSIADLSSNELGVATSKDGHVYYSAPNRSVVEVLYLHLIGAKRLLHWFFPVPIVKTIHCFSSAVYGFPLL
jgi:hypothetical protein